jgi:hypothetical protein
MINADVEFLTGLIALKTEEFSGLVDVLKTVVFLPAPLQGM